MIPYGRQNISQEDLDAVQNVLTSDYLTQGPAVPAFEKAASSKVGARHAVAANSATSALHMACIALGVTKGDIVWTVPNTFVASANCARYCGASVDFVDISPTDWNIDIDALKRKLSDAKSTEMLPKVVIPVHFGGQPTHQKAIHKLAQEFGFKIIEDASHSIGAVYENEPVGSCKWSDITVFSFHPVKIITSGEGGMALTNDIELFTTMQLARSHGVTRDSSLFTLNDYEQSPPAWYYEQTMLGYNYRMTDIHAALGLSQLSQLDQNIEKRNAIAVRYDQELASLPIQLPSIYEKCVSAFHLYVIRLSAKQKREHRAIFERLRERGIGVNLHYLPVHLQPDFRRLGFAPGDFPESECHGQTAISLPMFPTLTHAQQDKVIAEVRDCFA